MTQDEVNELFADIHAYIGKDPEEMNADKNLIENFLYEDYANCVDNSNPNFEAAFQAYADRAMFVESLRPEEDRVKVIFGIPPRRNFYDIIKAEVSITAYFALKKYWLYLLKQEKELLEKRK